jgi:hypothetical protein
MLIRHHNATKGPKYDINFAISAIRCYKPTYILADKAYDTEIIKQTITEETTALPQIPVKTRQNKVVHIEASVEQYSDLKYTDSETKLKEPIVLKKENLVE